MTESTKRGLVNNNTPKRYFFVHQNVPAASTAMSNKTYEDHHTYDDDDHIRRPQDDHQEHTVYNNTIYNIQYTTILRILHK